MLTEQWSHTESLVLTNHHLSVPDVVNHKGSAYKLAATANSGLASLAKQDTEGW